MVKTISRKDFIKGLAAVGTATATSGMLAGCQASSKGGNIPEKWDKETEVIILGMGAAGLSSAIAAYDAGAKVIILEKAPQNQAGGNTRVSGNMFLGIVDMDMARKYYEDFFGGFGYPVPDEMLTTFLDNVSENPDWMKSLGAEISPFPYFDFPEIPESEGTAGYQVVNYDYPGTWNLLFENVTQRKIEILYETPGKELVQDPDNNAILGVIAEQAGNRFTVKATKAVILCTGGYENNQEMHQNYLRIPGAYPLGSPHNTGDGVKMAQKAGADLWHMQNFAGAGSVTCGLKLPEYDNIFKGYMDIDPIPIYVGKDSTRFVNETAKFAHGKTKMHGVYVPCPLPLPIHIIFDETRRLAGPINSSTGWLQNRVENPPAWSEDNSVEIEKGWITKADTIRELAEATGRDPDALEATINEYNEFCKNGEDKDFNRPAEKLIPIETPPFYAMEMTPLILNTQGGPRRNTKAQIVDPFGEPIPRLYSSGELGSIHSYGYQGFGNIGEGLAFGRIAGKNAAAEDAWS